MGKILSRVIPLKPNKVYARLRETNLCGTLACQELLAVVS